METVIVDQIPGTAKPVENVDYQVLAGTPGPGDYVRVRDGSCEMFTRLPPTPPAPPAQPKTLEALDFIRHAAAQITPARVVAIEEAFRDHASADLRYAWKEYDKAKSFTKEKVDEFLSAGVSASILTAQERAAVLDNWPT